MTDNDTQNTQDILPSVIDMVDLTNVRELRNLLTAHGMRPNKSFGQNFLIDRGILNKIVQAAEIMPEDELLEVGAGTGVLTRELAQKARRVVAVEIERDMLTLLAQTTRQYPNVELIARNLLFLNPSEVFGETSYKLVANLPYYITAPTFRHFLENANPPRILVVMVQWEVAQRIVAAPGDLSLLAISVQFYGRPQIVSRVPAQAFYPAPKVDSAILRIDVHEQAPLTHEERDRFFKVVQAGFSEKRKQLHNSLTHGLHHKNELIRNWMNEAAIDTNRRAETLNIDEWMRLWRVIDQATRTNPTIENQ
ncbi:16S rRNA (adenine(1518)-N(6)/adenine(1519)-N(6))-dimethyltransferase RsmA [Dictyobacter kobayashii]|uniref:Ribosomal RNA small subunit methyltransferase A n=1 Tax=Dictyobacter kobayashii TaxID=2014872 RepID=A0A402AIN5_9CHLR|nr:16S rRNA (adenine(1518)-N(6)/adenine(1519)-N(6))-dimethyltransferase RsmA [Dictyobacter kobayashii]GCE18925.1 ribosomal RNA small subunit methyltransferase A [Dictyobacter kobayashii]